MFSQNKRKKNIKCFTFKKKPNCDDCNFVDQNFETFWQDEDDENMMKKGKK